MSLLHAPVNQFNFTTDNWGANPSTTAGTSVSPGTSGAEGSFTELIAGSALTEDCYLFTMSVNAIADAATSHRILLDIGVDPAGGTSWTSVITDLIIGGCNGHSTGDQGIAFTFPLFVPSGSSIAARMQDASSTLNAGQVLMKCWGKPSRPEMVPVGRYAETVGSAASSLGVSVTPGNAADGTWTSIGTTVKDLWYWQLGMQVNNTVRTAESTYVELAWGDGTNKVSIMKGMVLGNTGELQSWIAPCNQFGQANFANVPAGTNIYARMRCSDAPDTGYNLLAYGVGG